MWSLELPRFRWRDGSDSVDMTERRALVAVAAISAETEEEGEEEEGEDEDEDEDGVEEGVS